MKRRVELAVIEAYAEYGAELFVIGAFIVAIVVSSATENLRESHRCSGRLIAAPRKPAVDPLPFVLAYSVALVVIIGGTAVVLALLGV